MMARKLLLMALMTILLAGCSTMFPLLNNEAAPTPMSTSITSQQLSCVTGLCVTRAYAFVDSERFNVMFDIVDQQGMVDLGNAPQFVDNMVVGAYYQKDGQEALLFGGEFTQGQYYCYAGEDIPWKKGSPAAACGFSMLLSEMQNYVPQVGDQIRISLPLVQDYSEEVTVQSAEEFGG